VLSPGAAVPTAPGGGREHRARDGRRSESIAHRVERGVDAGGERTIEGQCELDRGVVVEVAEGQADERDPSVSDHRHRRGEQDPPDREDRLGARGRLQEGVRPRRPREVVEPQPKDDRAADAVGRSQPAGEPVDQRDQVGIE
jgi:hypothetical protein